MFISTIDAPDVYIPCQGPPNQLVLQGFGSWKTSLQNLSHILYKPLRSHRSQNFGFFFFLNNTSGHLCQMLLIKSCKINT